MFESQPLLALSLSHTHSTAEGFEHAHFTQFLNSMDDPSPLSADKYGLGASSRLGPWASMDLWAQNDYSVYSVFHVEHLELRNVDSYRFIKNSLFYLLKSLC